MPIFVLNLVLLAAASTAMVALTVGAGKMFARARRNKRDALLPHAERLLAEGRHEDAIRATETLLAHPAHSAHEHARYVRAQCWEELGDLAAARAAYLDYLARHDTDVQAPAERRARARERLGQILESTWDEPLRRPWDEPGRRERTLDLVDARRFLERGEIERARPIVERIALDRTQPLAQRQALALLGWTYETEAKYERARVLYRRYLRQTNADGGDPIRAWIQARVQALSGPDPSPAEETPWRRFVEATRLEAAKLPPQTADVEATGEPPRRSEASVREDLERLSTGRRVGPYVLAEKLGEGGFGEVYRGLREVAVKFARDPEERARLERLGELQGRVDSERIVKPLEVVTEGETPYAVLEFVDGVTLRDLLDAHERLTPDAALAVAREVARALRDTHTAEVAHLDLKPANVLIGQDGAVKLTDFELGVRLEREGVAHSLSVDAEAERVAGTLPYMAPEQRAGKHADAQSDIYTFGVVLFESLTGQLPEPGDRPSDFVAGLDPRVDAIFERCFARRERRYADATALTSDLERVALAKVELGALVRTTLPEPAPEPVSSPAQAAAADATPEVGPELEASAPQEAPEAAEERTETSDTASATAEPPAARRPALGEWAEAQGTAEDDGPERSALECE